MKRTYSIQVKKNQYKLKELNTDGSNLTDDEYYDWIDKYNVVFVDDNVIDNIICVVCNKQVEQLTNIDEVPQNITIYNEVLNTNMWKDKETNDDYIYYVKPKINKL